MVLRQTAERLAAALRPQDFWGRWGGEEFVVLLPHTELIDAFKVAERLRRSCAEAPFLWRKTAIPLTVSIGVATLEKQRALQTLLRLADEALYAAKQAGRNRVEAAP